MRLPDPPNDDDLSALAAVADRAGIFLDFDGTLAPIVPEPAAARPLPGAGDVLGVLADRFAVVAIVSGRPASFLIAHLDPPANVRVVGLYGVEQVVGGALTILPEAEEARAAVERAAEGLTKMLADEEGVFVEHKGLSVAVHFRRAPEPDAAQARSEATIRGLAEYLGLGGVHVGRKVIEVSPTIAVSKGSVVRDAIASFGLRGAMMCGDDLGDVPAFRALEGLEVALRVAVASDESPRALLDAADRIVHGPAELLQTLERLARATAQA